MISVNQHYFDSITTEQQAYWLGYLRADGYVARQKPWVVIVNSTDHEHMQLLADHLGYTGKLKYPKKTGGFEGSTQQARLEICRKHMCQVIAPLKYTNDLPNLSHELLRHWMRGYFDGDGSIFYAKNSSKGKSYSYLNAQIIGEIKLIQQMQELLLSQGIQCRIKKTKSDHMKYLCIHGGNNIRKLHAYLYNDSTVSLERKAKKWEGAYRPYGEKSSLANPEYAGNS